jgi:hypothetical protein
MILAIWEAEIGRMALQAKSTQDPISKITRAKWTGGVAQVAEHLLCKHKALNSNYKSHQKKKKKKASRAGHHAGYQTLQGRTQAWSP